MSSRFGRNLVNVIFVLSEDNDGHIFVPDVDAVNFCSSVPSTLIVYISRTLENNILLTLLVKHGIVPLLPIPQTGWG